MIAPPELWVDASGYQPGTNWAQVKADGVDGAIVKCNEGTLEDGQFAANWPAVLAAGLKRGAYDFAYTSNTAAFEAAQFVAFIKAAGGWRLTDILVLDIESNAGNLSAAALSQWVLNWCAAVKAATGITPWVYSYQSFIRTYLQNGGLAAYPLWFAYPSATPPACPAPWKTYVAWQYGEGPEAGVSGLIDLDRVYLPDPPPDPPDPPEGDPVIVFLVNNGPTGAAGGYWMSTPGLPYSPLVSTPDIVAVTGSAGCVQIAISTAQHQANLAALQPSLAALATASEVAQVDADVKAIPAASGGLTAAEAASLTDVQTHVDADLH
jgi:GH25 family lysozyme M1 (1,4-beta-N-acetylmuramidase)